MKKLRETEVTKAISVRFDESLIKEIKKIIEKNFWEEVRKIPKMSSDEVDTLNINSKFMMKILSELEEM